MRYCPTCRQGYEDTTDRCPQCYETLVDDSFKTPCSLCGEANRINRTFCWKCGHDFLQGVGAANREEPAENRTFAQVRGQPGARGKLLFASDEPEEANRATQPASGQKPESTPERLARYGGVVGAVIGGAAGLVYYVVLRSPGGSEVTPDYLLSTGLIGFAVTAVSFLVGALTGYALGKTAESRVSRNWRGRVGVFSVITGGLLVASAAVRWPGIFWSEQVRVKWYEIGGIDGRTGKFLIRPYRPDREDPAADELTKAAQEASWLDGGKEGELVRLDDLTNPPRDTFLSHEPSVDLLSTFQFMHRLEHFPVEVQWFKKIHRRPLLGRPAVGLAMGIGGVVIGLVFLALGRSSRRG